MSRSLTGLAVAVAGIFVTGCGQTGGTPKVPNSAKMATAESDTPSKPAFLMEDFAIHEPVQIENLTIFPVSSRVPKTEDRFLTLDEGLKAGTVEVREIGTTSMTGNSDTTALSAIQQADEENQITDPGNAATEGQQPGPQTPNHDEVEFDGSQIGNEVNTLIVVNRSDKPLYLMPGEVIIGGSQDRTIGNELVIAPDSRPTQVPVFCVEHGRWGAKGAEETLSQIENANGSLILSGSVSIEQTQSIAALAQEADRGKFIGSVGHLSKKARVAVQSEKDQSAVWANVAATNSSSGVSPVSGAFTANYVDEGTIRRLEPYLQHLQSPVAEVDQVVGVLVAINGKIESIDVFESTPLSLGA